MTEEQAYYIVLGVLLHQLRERKGLSQSDFARVAIMTQATISRIERGHGKPDASEMRQIALALGLSPPELYALHELLLGQMDRLVRKVCPVADEADSRPWWVVVFDQAGTEGLAGLVTFGAALAVGRMA